MKYLKLTIIFLILSVLHINAYCDEIYLKNGDKITGDIVKEEEQSLSVKTEAMGLIYVNRAFIDHIAKVDEDKPQEPAKKGEEIILIREVAAGYNATTGNTRDSQLSGSLVFSRNRRHIDEWTAKGNLYYSSSDREMDAQKWYGMGRYAFSFGKTRMWYNFYKIEADHDRFADIDYRIVPASGIGYWLYDLPEIKIMAEAGLGFEHTDYRGQTEDSNEVVLVPRAFLEKELFANCRISQDIFLYNPVDDLGEYRFHSETAFNLSMDEKLSLRLSLVNDYNSKPPENTKKNDMRFISELVYSF